MEPITYTVDDEPQTTATKTLTPRQILTAARIDEAVHYLVLLRGNSGERESYQTRMDEPIHMHPNMKFISVSTGPTTVS
ncbi:MAG: hypothetical protein ABI837_15430 [Acidobacteriota bacterium]